MSGRTGVSRIAAVSVLMLTLGALRAEGATCTISATPVSFGAYNVFVVSATDSTGSLTFRCTGTGNSGSNISISIALSKGGSGSFTSRAMLATGNSLGYNLYRNAARTTIWGDGTGGTRAYVNTNVTRNQNIALTVYGRIPAQQDVTAGSYADTVTATINF
jgi:spore coat protein U-like protein